MENSKTILKHTFFETFPTFEEFTDSLKPGNGIHHYRYWYDDEMKRVYCYTQEDKDALATVMRGLGFPADLEQHEIIVIK